MLAHAATHQVCACARPAASAQLAAAAHESFGSEEVRLQLVSILELVWIAHLVEEGAHLLRLLWRHLQPSEHPSNVGPVVAVLEERDVPPDGVQLVEKV